MDRAAAEIEPVEPRPVNEESSTPSLALQQRYIRRISRHPGRQKTGFHDRCTCQETAPGGPGCWPAWPKFSP